jgi:hypothetical protein
MLATKWPEKTSSHPRDDSIMELSLMMSRRQFEALEQQAGAQGLSVAQFLRRLVQNAIEEEVPLGWHG